jgi:hypothetical protein
MLTRIFPRHLVHLSFLLLAAFVFNSCAGRPPAAVTVSTPADYQLDCAGIAKAIGGNNWEMLNKARESLHTSAKNADAVVKTFPFGLLMLMALDVNDAAGTELEMFGERSKLLSDRAAKLGCDSPHAYSVEEAIAEEADERARLPTAGYKVVEVGSGGDDPDGFSVRSNPTKPGVRTEGVRKTNSTQVQATPVIPSRDATTMQELMRAFLRGEIDQQEYAMRRRDLAGP